MEKYDSFENWINDIVSIKKYPDLERLFKEDIGYTKKQIKEVLHYPNNIIGDIKLLLFMRKEFFINYWKVYRLKKIDNLYYWIWRDDLLGVF